MAQNILYPRLLISLRLDGSLDDLNVLASDHDSRFLGWRILEQLREEVDVFEARAKTRLAQLNETQ